MKSLDPRVGRLPVPGTPGVITPKIPLDQFGSYEVFVQGKEGKPFQHEGIVHAPNLEMAFVLAKEAFTRRFTCVSLYVVDTREVFVSPTTEGETNAYDAIVAPALREASGTGSIADYEIYHLPKRGKQHVHAGTVSAGSPEVAMWTAKQTLNSKQVFNIWAVRSAALRRTQPGEADLWQTLPEKKFRDASDYKGGDKLKDFLEKTSFMNDLALNELLYKMADDLLILGHRNSEWTGMGPLLEEDIAFSSMAQDKIGQSYALFQMLKQRGEQAPDIVAFTRNANQFHNCVLCELPNQEYDFSLIRHFLFDTADALRWEMLTHSSFEPLAQLARKVQGELRYHTLHANTWMKQLGSATEESVGKLQRSLVEALPYALGIFETSPYEADLISDGIFAGEDTLRTAWMAKVESKIAETQLQLPDWKLQVPVLGGRVGKHSPHLQPMLEEMSEVFRTDPTAEW